MATPTSSPSGESQLCWVRNGIGVLIEDREIEQALMEPSMLPVVNRAPRIWALAVWLPRCEPGDAIRCVCTRGEKCHGYRGQCYNGAIEGVNNNMCENCA
jgi:hypothetical protein